MSGAQRRKGRDGEAELRERFVRSGFAVTASQRNLGGGQADAIVTYGGRSWRVECKRSERLNIWQALAQVEADGSDVLAFRRNGGKWYAAVPLDVLCGLLKDAGT